jgi:hypothetical protein
MVHIIDNSTTAHSAMLTTTATATRETTGMRRIDHGADCAGCGDAGP